jgi:peptidoglycan/xylan/chitin deacetylase (PgdA/CDA1 family)
MDGNRYRVIVRNDLGSVTSNYATLTVSDTAAMSGYYIAITTDDGPKVTGSPEYLDALAALNSRPGVVCGKNPEQWGVAPCRPGIGCNTVCGHISRAHITFYVNGGNYSVLDAWGHPVSSSTMVQRILRDGHEIANHTTSHLNLGTSNASAATIRTEINTTETRINQAVTHIIGTGVTWGSSPEYGSFTDFYGRTYSASNPFRSKSFRPGFFSISPGAAGLDRDFFGPGEHLPWIFAGLDVDDWRGHSGREMADFILNGTHRPCPRCGPNYCTIGPNGNLHPGVRNVEDSADGGIILIHDGGMHWAGGRDMMNIIIPEMQEMGYHFVTVEMMFEFMNAEPEWLPATIVTNSTRVNDWIRRPN